MYCSQTLKKYTSVILLNTLSEKRNINGKTELEKSILITDHHSYLEARVDSSLLLATSISIFKENEYISTYKGRIQVFGAY